jgi:hypothetical protein
MEREQNITVDSELNYTLKRKGESLEKETTKYQKVSDLVDPVLDHFQELPNEIIRQIAFLSESLPTLLLSLTCSRLYNLFNRDNRAWHSIYLRERQIHTFSIKNTIATDLFGPDMVSRHFEREQESLQTSWQTPLTSDCLDVANDIIAEEDSFQKYFQLRFYNDDILIKYPRKDVLLSEYSDSVNYKKLALKTWYKYNQFELWSVQKKMRQIVQVQSLHMFHLSRFGNT